MTLDANADTPLRFEAEYYDGLSSRPHAVTVTLSASGVLSIRGAGLELEYPVARAVIAPRLSGTVRSFTLPGGAKCESQDHAGVDALEALTGQGRLGWVHQLESRWRSALLGVLIAAGLGLTSFRWLIPLAAEGIAGSVPESVARELGTGTLSALDRSLFSETTLSEAEQQSTRELFASLARQHEALSLRLVFREMGQPNALALPDGTIVVTDKLVRLATDPEQIRAVLMHEVGHIHHRHALRRAIESSVAALLTATFFGDATQMTGLISVLPALYVESHYSRGHETEADSFAIEGLRARGIPTRHFADVMRKLSEAVGESEGAGHYLSSHPPTQERIQRFE